MAYSMTKAAAISLAEWLAISHHHQGIRFSVLCPQAVATNIVANSPQNTMAAQAGGGDKGFEQLVAKVVGFVEAPALGLDLPLDVRGTAFQQRVWKRHACGGFAGLGRSPSTRIDTRER